MCSTTTGTQAANGTQTGNIPPNSTSGGGSTPGTGAPFPQGPAPLIGEPEFFPQITFIAQPSPTDNGFIDNAVTFHRNAGISPNMITSMQEIVTALNNTAQTGTGIINHLRIVSHFFVNDEAPGLTPSNIRIAMLQNGATGILQHHLEGWAVSNYAGLKAMLTILVSSGGTTANRPGVYADSLARILTQLRPAHNTIIDQIPVDLSGEPTGLHNDFVLFAASKWALTQFPTIISNATIRNNVITAYDLLMNDLKTRIATPTSAQLTTLATAMAALPDWGSFTHATPANMAAFGLNVSSGIAAFNGNFFGAITTMRTRINQYSTVDIRGCQAGNDSNYMHALRTFFGTSGTVRPTVTAPTRFQRFNGLNQITGLNSQTALNALFNSGMSPFNATETRNQFDTWATGFGITQDHLTFWTNTFQLPAIEFCKLQWRSSIPARRVTIPRLDNLATANFSQVFDQLADIFFFTAAQKPTTTQLGVITPLLPNLTAWTTELNTVVPDTATPAELTQHFNTLKTIYEATDPRTSNPAFGGRVIPSTAPPLTVALINNYRTSLTTFINTNTNSVFATVKTFQGAGEAQAGASQSRLRYFFRLGLVLQLYHATSPNFNHQIIIAFTDASGSRRQDEAIRHWIRALWRGTTVPTIPATITWENGRNGAWIVENRDAGPSYVCPNDAYKNHITVLANDAP